MLALGELGQTLHRMAWKLQESGARGSVDADDLVAVASIEVLRARGRFDPSRGSWRRFALARAGGAMLDELRRLDFVPRVERARIRREGGDLRKLFSLTSPHEDDVPIELPDPSAGNPSIEAEREDFWADVRDRIGRRRADIVERYLRGEYRFHEIGEAMGLSESRVYQLYHQAIRILREEESNEDAHRRNAQ